MIDRASDERQRAVREYFDRDAAGYARAYGGSADDSRSRTFQERRALSLEALRTPIGRVLDIGAGPGVFTAALVERAHGCWVVDLSFEMIALARRQLPPAVAERAAFAVGAIERLPFADEAFDTVVCIGVFQYLDAVSEAMAELARITRPGGQIVLSFPNGRSPLNRLHMAAIAATRWGLAALARAGIDRRPSPSRLTFRHDLPNRTFSEQEVARRAASAGLRIESVTYHLLLFPFSVPGLGALIRLWNRAVGGRIPRGRFASWGREGIVRLARA